MNVIVFMWRKFVLIVRYLLGRLRRNMDDRLEANRSRGYFWCKQSLGGTWASISEEEFQFSVVSGGLTNYLYLCSLPEGVVPLEDEPTRVLLRIYGDIAIDREFLVRNTAVFAILSAKNLGPKLYAVCSEGRLEEYIPTQPLRTRDLQVSDLSEQIAKKIALFHGIKDMPLCKKPRFIDEKVNCWMNDVEEVFSHIDRVENAADRENLKKLQSFNLREEASILLDILKKAGSPVVFSHNDLQEGNILYMENAPPDKKMTFIDWEYCSYNFRGFDFGNHFCEWCFNYTHPVYPFYEHIENNYPSRSQQYTFFRHYLSQIESEEPSEATLDHLYREANTFALGSHFFWGLWSVVQRELSDIEFGYLDYAVCRFEAYFKLKESLHETGIML